jgi:hypothetical protein
MKEEWSARDARPAFAEPRTFEKLRRALGYVVPGIEGKAAPGSSERVSIKKQ